MHMVLRSRASEAEGVRGRGSAPAAQCARAELAQEWGSSEWSRYPRSLFTFGRHWPINFGLWGSITFPLTLTYQGRPSTYTPRCGVAATLYAYGSRARRTLADLAPPTVDMGGAIYLYLSLHRAITPDCYLLCVHMLMSSHSCPDVSRHLIAIAPVRSSSPVCARVAFIELCGHTAPVSTPPDFFLRHLFPRHCSRATAAASFSFHHRHTVPSQCSQCSVTLLNIVILGNTS
jgi:hypothetical protein